MTKDKYAMVSVRDEGMGVPLQDQAKLFDRFYRVEGQQTQSIAGFGIGLYICKEIISRHNGQIGVESEPGKGSIFWFTLPVA
ncbi:sensor histidine kinase [Mucilaginibacter lacusdianchii]|uniref:sensor histidine kinase n=1 Tax=Mucilaginibacter lacusdianchii TaxID=2684211 RepID=UPI00131D4CCA|nr:ATP-binding protein [Mucilaginibacter sp. JXJ CY 39]